ncbi:MAG: hypothetical protein IPQ07_24825 [Myxococcales bacterium]|nr:hypothetical protein [Myxococcales bacterium]
MRSWWFVVLAGCYQPQLEPTCSVECSATSGCPDGLVCDGKRCAPPEGCGPVLDDAGSSDAPTGCFGADDLVFCPQRPLEPTRTVTGDVDTASDSQCEIVTANGITACVIAGGKLAITGSFKAHGVYALVLAGDEVSIPVGAEVDVSSHVASVLGAGRRACASGVGLAGGGGAGGAFGTKGGPGGTPMTGGASGPISLTAYGGCDGGGGGRTTGVSGGEAGGGGGVAILIGRQSVTIDGAVRASGAGGRGGINGGGGGGGSGGSIVVITPRVIGNGTLHALGGGGAGGGSSTTNGGNGSDPDSAGVAIGGAAGSGGAGGGPGGAGGGQDGGAGTTYGGGGGGGLGRISLRASDKSGFGTAKIVPAPTTP